MIHIEYHGVLLWNEITVDWLIMGMQFGILSFLGARMRSHGLVRPLFLVQTWWFGIPDVCNAKGECLEHGIDELEVPDDKDV